MGLPDSFPIACGPAHDAYRVAPAGELDIATVPLLEAAFEQAERDAPGMLLLDLSAITFIDSTGIQLLLRLSDRTPERITIVASPAISRLLDITGLSDQLPLAGGP